MMTFQTITPSASSSVSNYAYREISCDNDLALSKFFRVQQFGNPSTISAGFCNLTNNSDDGKFNYLPFKNSAIGDVLDDCIFLDNSDILTAKIKGKLYPIIQSGGFNYIQEVTNLPTGPFLSGYSPIVIHQDKLKFYNKTASAWETVTSN